MRGQRCWVLRWGQVTAGGLTARFSILMRRARIRVVQRPEADGPPDDIASTLVEPTVGLVGDWLRRADATVTRAEKRSTARMHRLTSDRASVEFTMAFADRVLRPESDAVAAEQLRRLVERPLPEFLGRVDRALLVAGASFSRPLPGLVMPLARRRLRQLVGTLVVDQDDDALRAHLARIKADGFRVNVNLLGESVLGEAEAGRRLAAMIDLLRRDDVEYVSIKASSVASQLNLWDYDGSLDRAKAGLRQLFAEAAATTPPTFVNLDMEEYHDLQLTIDAFTQLLDETEFQAFSAGIVLQAYLPDSLAALRHLQRSAHQRHARGGAAVKVRIVKGANLAMERVEAAMHRWEQAPYDTKAGTDANYVRLLDWALHPARLQGLRVGVASHNVFDVAWAKLLADARGVTTAVDFEMLQGMAPSLARVVRDATGGMLLYTPVVATADFDHALAYLFRRLEENSSGDNFLRHLFGLGSDAEAFAVEQARFEVAVAERWHVSAEPRRRSGAAAAPDEPRGGFSNEPDADATDPSVRAAMIAALLAPPVMDVPEEIADFATIDDAVALAAQGRNEWQALAPTDRAHVLHAVGDLLAARRGELIAVMAHEAGKTIAEGNPEVSEAADFARYYAARIDDLGQRDGARFEPLGVVAVVPPWNFPLAIPAGGVLAALAAGNAVLLKPAPQTPRTAFAFAQVCWDAGVPQSVLQFVRCPDSEVAEHLVGHGGVDGIILTGSIETAEHLRSIAPTTPLFAETSGKNAIVVMPDADLDLAVADIMHSAFGHAGQKCSAASLAICVGSVATSKRFRRQLVDAAGSMIVAPATRPESVVAELVGAPPPKLERALTRLDPGQRWLLEPRLVDARINLWSPGIVDGVANGSWFHVTECFGPVLGLMAARDLDEALELQSSIPYGLTGGLHTLDPLNVERWLELVQVGNAYINRGITGAIVRRQPFGGWKQSVVGPGAKAGGPNYVAQLGTWQTRRDPRRGKEPLQRVAAFVRSVAPDLAADDRRSLECAVRSDAHAWHEEFTIDHDPSALFCESNVLRYRPLPLIAVRIAPDAHPFEIARVLAAAILVDAPLHVSVARGVDRGLGSTDRVEESPEPFAEWARRVRPDRVRLLGSEPELRTVLPATMFLDDRPPLSDGRVELLRYLREQAVSRTLHRFGNLVGAANE